MQAIDFSTIHGIHNLMSTEVPPTDDVKPKGKLKTTLDEGGIPADPKIDPKTPDAELWDVDFEIKEDDKILNQANFDKSLKNQEKLVELLVTKEVKSQRDKLLTQIKEADEETYEAEKDNQTINELQVALRTAQRIKKTDVGGASGRVVGAVDKDKVKDAPKTQYDHLKDEFISG